MIIAIYSPKGGVGKTTLAVNLAWASAVQSSRRTLLWDLDPEGGATFTLGHQLLGTGAQESITGEGNPLKLVRPTAIKRLNLLPADPSLRNLELSFHELGKRKRLAKVAGRMIDDYDRIFLDCAPGLTGTTDQILRAADLVIVPVVPAALPSRALDHIQAHLSRSGAPRVTLLPVYSMVDRRKSLHRKALVQNPEWPVIPMASSYEQMGEKHAAVGQFLPRSADPVTAVSELWQRVERRLTSPMR